MPGKCVEIMQELVLTFERIELRKLLSIYMHSFKQQNSIMIPPKISKLEIESSPIQCVIKFDIQVSLYVGTSLKYLFK